MTQDATDQAKKKIESANAQMDGVSNSRAMEKVISHLSPLSGRNSTYRLVQISGTGSEITSYMSMMKRAISSAHYLPATALTMD